MKRASMNSQELVDREAALRESERRLARRAARHQRLLRQRIAELVERESQLEERENEVLVREVQLYKATGQEL